MSSCVRFAAMTPEMIAVSKTGPFFVRCPLARSAVVTLRGRRTLASATASRWLASFVPTSTDVEHLDLAGPCGRLPLRLPPLAVVVGPIHPDATQRLEQLIIGGAAAQRIAQARSVGCKETGVEHAVGGQSRARAVAAEGLGDGGDEAHFPAAIGEGITFRHLAAVFAAERH